jgi:hypothetical protein
MKKITRHNVFETNSSSTHSISLSNEVEKYDTLYPNENGVFVFEGGEFGWEWDDYSDAYAKANYAATMIEFLGETSSAEDSGEYSKFKDLFERVIKDHVGCEIEYDFMKYAHIDYQSMDVAWSITNYTYDELKNFIFNPKSVLYTGNDNDGMKWENGHVVRNR